MYRYDEQLYALQSQCARKKKLEATAAELRAQREACDARANELKERFLEEQADVDRLEGRSLSAFFYSVLGKKEEKLTKEKQEAYAARLKYDAVLRELAEIEAELRQCEAELDSLQGCEERYAAVMQEKIRAIKAAGGGTAEQLLTLEARAAYLDSQDRELMEAIAAGQDALATTDEILKSLNSAAGWGTWDLVGGGLLTDMAKHSHLDNAQAAVETLQSQLRRFRTELADVTIDADIQISIDGFLRMADYFLDNIFTDWAVLDRIHQSQSQVDDTRSQISNLLYHLQTLLERTTAERSDIRQQIERLVGSVSM